MRKFSLFILYIHSVVKCKSGRCKTCPELNTSSTAISNVSNKTYVCVNVNNSLLSCTFQNLIYLMTCNVFNLQYVGETTTRLNIRMNGHRSSTNGCPHVINHKKTCTGATFSIQILKKLIGDRYGDNNKPDADITVGKTERITG